MAEQSAQSDTPRLSAAALDEWGHHVESVMRGIAHALNNRAAALSAVIELTRDPDDDASVTSSILASELERVRELVEVVRSVGSPRGGTEAFAPGDAAAEALAVLKLHSEQREHPVTIDASSAPATRVPRWMFVRSLIALGAGASNRVASAKTPVHIVLLEDGDWLVTRVEEGSAGGRMAAGAPCAEISPYAAELSRAMGGGPLEAQCGFRVPTLAALRRREAR